MFYGLAITPFRTCWNPGKDKDSTALEYYSCDSEQSTTAVDSLGATHQLKHGSVKKIPATALSQKLAGKMLVFTK